MKSYNNVRLQTISEKIGSGMTPLRTNTEYWNSKDIPWVKTELLGQYIISETSEYISQKAFEENSLTLFPANTLSIAMYGEGKTRGNVSIFGMPMTSNQACCNLIIDEQKADYKYVYYALKNNYDNLRNLASGVRNNLNADLIKNFEIPLPDLPTQKKIADVLSCIDDKIALNNKTNTELENMAKTIYDYWFTQFDFPDKNGHPYKTSGGQMVYNETLKREIPAGWGNCTFNYYIERITNGLNPRKNFVLGNGNNYYVTIRSLLDNDIDWNNCDKCDDEALQKINSRSQLQIGDVIFSAIGTIGRTYRIYEEPKNWNISETSFTIRPKKDIPHDFFYCLLRSPEFQLQSEHKAMGSTLKCLVMDSFCEIPCIKVDLSIANKFSTIVAPMYKQIYDNNKQNRELTKLRDYLLPLLMNGQIEVK